MAGIQNLKRLVSTLEAKVAKAKTESKQNVEVGFSAAYAIFAHEDMQAKHEVGQAKFLEVPARRLTNSGTLSEVIRELLHKGKTMAQALLVGGLLLQREAQKLCPVDTGGLKASAFTRSIQD